MSNSDTEVPIKSDTISQSQVNEQLRCSVCHEDFNLSEPVSRLVCDHVFHPSCITPWLERRDTCPVCRRVLREAPDPDTDSDDDLFADDEDDSAVVEQEVVVLDNAVSDGLVTVSVQYRSMVDQQTQAVFQSANMSSDLSITISDSDSDSDVFPDFFDSNSLSTSSGNSNVDAFNTSFELSGNIETLSDCDGSHVCFLELDDSYDTDTSDTMDIDFMNSFESDDLNFSSSSNYFDNTFESNNMDIDHDLI